MLCVENYTILILIAIVIGGYLLWTNYVAQTNREEIIINNNIHTAQSTREVAGGSGLWRSGWWGLAPSWPYNNLGGDIRGGVLLDPYTPPVRDERYAVGIPAVPINVSTNIGAVETSYRQVGILNPLNTKGGVLALMGRPVFTNRDKWQYYTMSEQQNSIKLPISRNGKSCMNEYGCDKLFNGDTIYVEGINEPYRVTLYDNDTIKYLPFL